MNKNIYKVYNTETKEVKYLELGKHEFPVGEQYVFMQCLGVKDWDGNYIFEQDICRYGDEDSTMIGYVEYCYNYACAMYHLTTTEGGTYDIDNWKHCKVIGNNVIK